MFADRVNSFNRSKRASMSAALILVSSITACGWILWPHVTYLKAVQGYEPVVSSIANKKDTVCIAIAAKERKLQAIQGERNAFREKFFTVTQAKEFFSRLECFAEGVGCTVASVDFVFERSQPGTGMPSDVPTLVAHRANLTVAGQYEDLTVLFEHIQGHLHDVWIDSCRIEVSNADPGRLRCDVALTIWVISDKEDSSDE